MSDPRIPRQWQLKDTGESGDQWMLRDSEQTLPDYLQLQGDDVYETANLNWQPVDYRALQQPPAARSRSGWILGTLVFLALVGVAAYMSFSFLGTPSFLSSLFQPLGSGQTSETEASEASTTGEGEAADGSSTDENNNGGAEAPAAGILTGTVPITDSSIVTAAMAAQPESTAVATPTATPLPLPTPTPVNIVVRTATVRSGSGVNLRRNPQGSAELIRTLPDNSNHVIASGPITGTDGGQWLQLALTDTLGYVAADFTTIVTQSLPYTEAAILLTSVGMAPPAPAALPAPSAVTSTLALSGNPSISTTAVITPPSIPTSTTPMLVAGSVTGSVILTTSAAATPAQGLDPLPLPTATPSVATAARAPSAAGTVTITAIINTRDGLNLRAAPQRTATAITLLPISTTVTLLARSTDGEWVRARTAAGQEGYLAADFLSISGNASSLPLDGAAEPSGLVLPTPTPSSVSTGANAQGTGALPIPTPTPTPAAAAPPASAPDSNLVSGGPGTLTVSNVSGVNVRPAPSNESAGIATLSWNATALTLGRTSDSQWVYVQLNDGTRGWVAASAVVVADGLASLAVLQ